MWRHDPSTTEVTRELRRFFMNLGIPQMLHSDGGLRFLSKEFEDFAHQWSFNNRRSSQGMTITFVSDLF